MLPLVLAVVGQWVLVTTFWPPPSTWVCSFLLLNFRLAADIHISILGADNAIEVSVVLPNATHVTANAYHNTDVFWAIRGGGGPSFGIATSITYKVHPQFPVYAAFFEATTNSPVAFVNLVDSFHSALPSLAEAGWSGYYPFRSGDYFALMYLLPNGNAALANSTLGVWIDEAAQMSGVTIKTNASTLYNNYEAWLFANILDPVNAIGFNLVASATLGIGLATASCLIPTDVFTDRTASNQLSQAMANMGGGIGQYVGRASSQSWLLVLMRKTCRHVGGGVVSTHPGDYNAIHPAWRDALVDLVIFSEWQDGTSETDIEAARQNLTDAMAPVRALMPDNPAQYLNEVSNDITRYFELTTSTFGRDSRICFCPTLLRPTGAPTTLVCCPSSERSTQTTCCLSCRV